MPLPAGTDAMRHPRVLYERGRGWHVFWLPELANVDAKPDSATIVHALFDGRNWSRVETIATVGTVVTGVMGLSQPVLVRDRIIIAMVDARSMNARRVVAFASNARGGWGRGIVSYSRPTAYVALAERNGVVTVAFTGRDTALHPTLYTSRSTDGGKTWSAPHSIVRASTSQPTIIAVNDALVTTWIEHGNAGSVQIRLARSRDVGGAWDSPIAVGAGAVSVDYAIAPLGTQRFLMLRHTSDQRGMIRIAIGRGGDSAVHWTDVGTHSEPFLPVVASGLGFTDTYVAWGEAVLSGGQLSPMLNLMKVRYSCPTRSSKVNLIPPHT